MGVPVGAGVIGVFVGVGVFVDARVGVFVGASVGVFVGAGVIGVGVFVGARVGVFVGVIGVFVGVKVSVKPTGAIEVSAMASGRVPKTSETVVRPTNRLMKR